MQPSQSKDLVTKFISIIIPVTVAECTRNTFNTKKDNLNTFTEKISAKIMSECNFEISDDSPVDLSKTTPNGMPDGELNHIQNMKLDLYELLQDIKAEIIDEVRLAIKDELRMELLMEISAAKSQLGGVVAKPESTSHSLGQFSTKMSKNTPMVGGLDAIKNKISTTETNDGTLLANNPLFAQVTKNIERNKQGKASYTPEEFLRARGDRTEALYANYIIQNADQYKEQYDEYDYDARVEDGKWDKLLRLKVEDGGGNNKFSAEFDY